MIVSVIGGLVPLCCSFGTSVRVCLKTCFTLMLSCPIDCSLKFAFTIVDSCWPGLGSVLRLDVCPCLFCVVLHGDRQSLLGSARGCTGSACISPVWLERLKYSLSSHTGLMLPALAMLQRRRWLGEALGSSLASPARIGAESARPEDTKSARPEDTKRAKEEVV